jgi:hypothetical protein
MMELVGVSATSVSTSVVRFEPLGTQVNPSSSDDSAWASQVVRACIVRVAGHGRVSRGADQEGRLLWGPSPGMS